MRLPHVVVERDGCGATWSHRESGDIPNWPEDLLPPAVGGERDLGGPDGGVCSVHGEEAELEVLGGDGLGQLEPDDP